MAPDATQKFNPWDSVPRRSTIIFLAAVFFTFSTMGFVGDISDMGREPLIRFVGGVLMSGLFAVVYAWSGVKLRSRSWMVFVPLFFVQVFLMGFLSNLYPDNHFSNPISAAEMAGLKDRLTYDSLATTVAILLAYVGFVVVFISEYRRHFRVHSEKVVLDTEMAAAREIQRVIVPEEAECFIGFCVDSIYVPGSTSWRRFLPDPA